MTVPAGDWVVFAQRLLAAELRVNLAEVEGRNYLAEQYVLAGHWHKLASGRGHRPRGPTFRLKV